MRKGKFILIAVFMIFMAVIIGGCGQDNVSKINVVGSTSVTPLMQELSDAYTANNSKVKIDVQGVGSTAGIKAVQDGLADIGMTSRELSKEEKEWGLKETVIAIDGIAVIVNPANPVKNLTSEQIRAIFKGEITNWSTVGGANEPILVVSREAGSGTRTAFEEMTNIIVKRDGKEVSLLMLDALIADGNGAVKTNVAGKENAIGYMSLGMLDNTVAALDVNNVVASEANVKNKTYTLARPFILLVKNPTKLIDDFLNYSKSNEAANIINKHYILP